MKSVIDDGAHDGIVEEFIYDQAAGKNEHRFAIKRTADVSGALAENARARLNSDGYSKTRDMRRVASIPDIIRFQWIEKFGVDPCAKGNEKLLWRLLNSNEYAHLRTDGKSSRLFVTPTRAVDVKAKPTPLIVRP